jgi:ElaB/YqjD/DUF883 family membrane-anchored ribosome-binding protein
VLERAQVIEKQAAKEAEKNMIQTASELGDKLHYTKEQVEAFARTAGKKLDEARRGTADVLAGSASSVRDAGHQLDELAERAASKLDSTAKYVRRHDAGSMLSHLGQVVRRNPAGFIIGGAAVGFLIALTLKRK